MKKRIRSIELSDAEAVRGIYAPFVSDNATSFEIDPPDTPTIERRIRDLSDQYPWLVFEADEKVLGYAYASPHRTRHAYQWSVDVSVYIHDLARGCGVGRALYRSLFEILGQQGYVNVYAGITLPNLASVGLHKSLGFVAIGVYSRVGFKFGKWHDVVWLHLRLSEAPAPIPNPIPAKELFFNETIATIFQHQAALAQYGPSPSNDE
jgi:L-amino acid N-acyltransferase YncA